MANNDWRDYEERNDVLAHSWGTSPKQKARERQYNHDYWERNRERILRARADLRSNLGFDAMDRRNAARDVYQRSQEQLEGTQRESRRAHDYSNQLINAGFQSDDEALRQRTNAARDVDDRLVTETGYVLNNKRTYDTYENIYSSTPLGKIENAARDAADAVNNALESVKNLTISALSNLRKR